MTREVAIVIRNRLDGSRRSVTVMAKEGDTVGDLLERVCNKCSVSSERLQLILGGMRLERERTIEGLSIGPATCLLALIMDEEEEVEKKEKVNTTMEGEKSASSFFAYCKNCEEVKAAKLRVNCCECDSSSVIVKREPSNWEDVLESHSIPIDCIDCSSPSPFARFVFKCTVCSEPCAALCHLRLPYPSVDDSLPSSRCTICMDTPSSSTPIIDLNCGHILCLLCFSMYIDRSLHSIGFHLHPTYGFTVGCAWPDCTAVVRDPHHFCIGGSTVYKEYKLKGVEAFVAREEGAVTCPHCTTAFIWERDTEGSRDNDTPSSITCPHCENELCESCHQIRCICGDELAACTVTINATTRQCPFCRVATERSGGCAHMTCFSCGAQWCFVCQGEWKEECQWNHWFN